MQQLNWKSERLAESVIDEFLSTIAKQLGVSADSLGPEKSGDIVLDTKTCGTYIVSLANKSAAFRFLDWQGARVVDLAHLKLADDHYRVVQRVELADGASAAGLPINAGTVLTCSEQPLPSFAEVFSVVCRAGQELEIECAQLLDELRQLQQERDYYQSLAVELTDELRRERSNSKKRGVIRSYSLEAGSLDEDGETAQDAVFDRWEQLPEWCVENADRIVVLPRALSGVKKALYEEPKVAFAALEFLAGPYREHKLGRLGPTELQSELERTGLRFAGSVGSSVAGEHKDDYFVSYRGRRRFLEHHLAKGGGRDERYCFRLYFFWDSGVGKAVVGWLPSHLDNSLT